MKDHPLLECHGGPWDGRHISDRGPRFPVTSTLNHNGTVTPRSWLSGVYERGPDGYHWRPSAE